MEKKKIFINGKFITQKLTGVQRTAFEMVYALDQLLNDKELTKKFQYYLIYSGKVLNPINLNNIQVLNKGLLKGILWEQFELPIRTGSSLLITLSGVPTLFKENQIMMVHDAAFVVNPHFFSKAFTTWYKFSIGLLGRKVKQIVTVSDFSKKELVKFMGFKEEKVTVIYNAAEHISRFDEVNSAFKLKIDTLKPYCLAVSSLSANKNFSGLSQALKKINFVGYNMVLAGGVSNTLQEFKPDSSVITLGYVTDGQLKYLYSNASLFVFPSFYEGFGIPPLEAMYCGCPAIVSNTSSLPEVLGEACEYFDPSNSDDIAQNINALLNNKNRLNELKEKGRIQARKYSWTTSAAQLNNLIINTSEQN